MNGKDMTGSHRTVQKHRWPAGDVMLVVIAVLSLGFSIVLLNPGLPAEGPATVVVYDFLPRQVWGVAWAVVALLPAAAVIYPTWRTRQYAVLLITVASMAWFVGLMLPLILEPHVGNALVIIWVLPIALGVVTTALVGFSNETIWRPTVKPRG